jgi:hypothetical protein
LIAHYSPGNQRITVGADKAFDTADFVADMRSAARGAEHHPPPLRH